MDYGNTLFVTKSLVEPNTLADLFSKCQFYGITNVAVVVPYVEKDFTQPKSEQDITFEKVVLVKNAKEAQNYRHLKSKKANTGSRTTVLFKPDFRDKSVENDIRSICEKGWCDVIIGLETNKDFDGLQKKKHYITQVEAKLMSTNKITVLFSQSNILAETAVPFTLNRISQIKHILDHKAVQTHTIVFASTFAQIKSLDKNNKLLDVF